MNDIAAAILNVTIVVLVTFRESVAVTVSYLVPEVTPLVTRITPVTESILKTELRFVIVYLIAPVPVPARVEILPNV